MAGGTPWTGDGQGIVRHNEQGVAEQQRNGAANHMRMVCNDKDTSVTSSRLKKLLPDVIDAPNGVLQVLCSSPQNPSLQR